MAVEAVNSTARSSVAQALRIGFAVCRDRGRCFVAWQVCDGDDAAICKHAGAMSSGAAPAFGLKDGGRKGADP